MPTKIFLQPTKTAAIWQHFMTMPTHLSLSHLVQNSSSKWIAATDITWPNCMTSTLLKLWEELYSAQLTSMIHCSSSETSSKAPLCCMDTYINENYAHTWCVLCTFGIAQLRYRYPANFTRKKIKLTKKNLAQQSKFFLIHTQCFSNSNSDTTWNIMASSNTYTTSYLPKTIPTSSQ